MKVLLLTQLYSDKVVAGGPRIIWNYSQALARQGIKVYLVANKIDTDKLPKHPNLRIYQVPLSRSYTYEPVNDDLLKSFFYSIPLILWHRIDIIHLVPIQSPCLFSRFKFGTRFVESTEKTFDYDNPRYKEELLKDRRRKEVPNFNFFEKIFLRFSNFFYWFFKLNQEYAQGTDAFFCRSRSMFSYLRLLGINSKLFYIPIGVNIEDFNPDVVPVPKDKNKVIFLSTGFLTYRKGIFYLIKAYKRFSEKYKNRVELWLVGDSKLATLNEFKQLADNDPSIKFFGPVHPSKISHYFTACDIYIAPALIGEYGPIQPNALEAMASAKPLIITEYGDTRDLPAKKIALTCKIADVDSLAQVMEKLFSDRELRQELAGQGLRYVRDNFSWDVIAKNSLKYYQEILNSQR